MLNSEGLRLRITDLEYKNLGHEEMEKEIRRIYFEEMGHELKAEIEILKSSNAENLKGDNSGYDGTAIYFKTEVAENNQLYIISQGSQQMRDWEYNLEAMVAGISSEQAESTYKFINNAVEEFQIDEVKNPAEVIGLSHSLAHNNNTTTQLVYGVFDKIYSVNGALTNYYQLYRFHNEFRIAVNQNFSLSRRDEFAIYQIDPEKLKEFTIDYYDKTGRTKNIHQLISLDDPLYGASGVRGFFTVGEVEHIDTNSTTKGIRTIMDQLPDEEVIHLQKLAIAYTIASDEGFEKGIQELTGFNLPLFEGVESVKDFVTKVYIGKHGEFQTMLTDMNAKAPGLLETVSKVTSNGDEIFTAFHEAGYLTKKQVASIVKELAFIEKKLVEVVEILNTNQGIREVENTNYYPGANPFLSGIGADLGMFWRLYTLLEPLQESYERLQTELGPLLESLGDSHSIEEMLNALGIEGGRAYMDGDLIMIAGGGGAEFIKVNISAAVRVYQLGHLLLEEKAEEVDRLILALDHELVDGFTWEKMKVMLRIQEIESNPSSYAAYANACLAPGYSARIVRADVHENLPPLRDVDFDYVNSLFRKEITKSQKFLLESRTAIENLFKEDEFISALFDYIPGGRIDGTTTFRFCHN